MCRNLATPNRVAANGREGTIGHLTDSGALARRHASFDTIPVLMNCKERVGLLCKQLKETSTGRPTKRTTLESKIQTTFGRCLSESEVTETMEGLLHDGIVILLDSGEVKYAA